MLTPDQDLRLSCVELAQDCLGGDATARELVSRAKAYYNFIIARGEAPNLKIYEGGTVLVRHPVLSQLVDRHACDE